MCEENSYEQFEAQSCLKSVKANGIIQSNVGFGGVTYVETKLR